MPRASNESRRETLMAASLIAPQADRTCAASRRVYSPCCRHGRTLNIPSHPSLMQHPISQKSKPERPIHSASNSTRFLNHFAAKALLLFISVLVPHLLSAARIDLCGSQAIA